MLSRSLSLKTRCKGNFIKLKKGGGASIHLFGSVRVASGALCDENVQYNMPGNLRLWDSATKNTNTLAGHHSVIPQPQQTIWRTVADIKVSHEGDLFFSGSHDGTTKVWKQSTGRLMSTLRKFFGH